MTHTALEKKSKQEAIFEKEIYPLADALYSFACRLTADSDRADELVQETFFKAWKNLEMYQVETKPKAWLFTICKNHFINEYRKNKREPYKVDYQDIVFIQNQDDPIDPRYFNLHEELHSHLIGDEITTAISKLKEIYRVVVLLDFEDFTYKEISTMLDIPIGTVRSRLHRGRYELAKTLREYAQTKGYGKSDNDNSSMDNDAFSA